MVFDAVGVVLSSRGLQEVRRLEAGKWEVEFDDGILNGFQSPFSTTAVVNNANEPGVVNVATRNTTTVDVGTFNILTGSYQDFLRTTVIVF